jgi:hypothetical protein
MIWYDCGNGWAPINWAKKNLGLDAILCCPGPSLTSQDLRGRGRKVFAINTAYPTITPDVWVGMDEMHCYDANLLDEPFQKVFRGTYSEMQFEKRCVKDCPETYFADVAQVPAGKTMLELRGHNVKFAWHGHTLGVALHMMIWMGAKNIYLAGCDMGGTKDYCHDLTLTDDYRKRNQILYNQQITFLKKLSKAAKSYGITLYSSTPDSPINFFLDYLSIDDLLNKSIKSKTYKPRYVLDKGDK